MKGSIGTSASLSYIKASKKKFVNKKINLYCTKCKKTILKGTWHQRTYGGLVKHVYCSNPFFAPKKGTK